MGDELDEFDQAVGANSDLYHTFRRQFRRWDETAEAIEMLLGMCVQRRLVTRTAVSFTDDEATVLLECGPRHVELFGAGSRSAATVARSAAGEGVSLRLCGVEPGWDGWVVSVISQCDTPLPHRRINISCAAITISYTE